MKIVVNLLIGLNVLLHIGFLVMEMFFWTTPAIRENFDMTLEQAVFSAPLAANQGLYNGFLAAGLVWGLLAKREAIAIRVFFLSCIIVAGLYGAATVRPSIFLFQSLPAIVTLLLVWLDYRQNHARLTFE